jgi:hypothetical protein
MTSCGPELFGADPANIRWAVVRGDTSTLRVDFLQNDEVQHFDISDWTFVSSAYDPKTDIIDELTVESFTGYVIISIPTDISAAWGTLYSGTVAELNFDLKATLDGGEIWTPVIGTISVIGNVSNSL